MMDPDVYDSFLKHVYGIFKGNCLYNKNLPPATKGEDFFQKTKCIVCLLIQSLLKPVKKINCGGLAPPMYCFRLKLSTFLPNTTHMKQKTIKLPLNF